VFDQYNKKFPLEVAGTGRINASKAINAEIIIIPPNLIFNLSPDNQIQTKYLKIKGINYDTISVRFEDEQVADFDYNLDSENLVINAKLIQQSLGEFENRMVITHNKVDYDIPIIVRVSKATIMVNDDNGKLSFDISSPTSWSYAKISITNKETGKKFTESITPNKNSELIVYQPGEYWIDAKIKNNNETLSAYTTIQIEKVKRDKENFENMLNLPEKPILIISAIMIIITITGLLIRKQH
jgi:minor extracellular serine protease Vpr